MAHASEIEIKLVASRSMLEELRGHPSLAAAEHEETLHTTYFDTVARRLGTHGANLRIREKAGGKAEQTLKLPTDRAAVRRREWTVEVVSRTPNIEAFPHLARAAIGQLVAGAPLQAYATVETTRTERAIRRNQTFIEVAFDLGKINAGHRCQDICELELELVSGRIGDLFGLALSLPLGPDLRWSLIGKAERSQALAFDLPTLAEHAKAPAVRATMDVEEGFRAIGWSALNHLVANHEVILATGGAEAVHQARVATRRLRAAFRLFSDVAHDGAAPVLGAELKAAAQALGKVRDLDVLLDHLRKSTRPPPDELLGKVAAQRDARADELRTLLAGTAFQRMLLETARWLEVGDWAAGKRAGARRQPILVHAARLLARRSRKLRKRTTHLPHRSDKALHRVRKRTKELRYLAEFLAEPYRGRPADAARRAFVAALAHAQNALGDIQDRAATKPMLDDLFVGLDPIASAGLKEDLKRALDRVWTKRSRSLKRARKSYRQALERNSWWRDQLRSLANAGGEPEARFAL